MISFHMIYKIICYGWEFYHTLRFQLIRKSYSNDKSISKLFFFFFFEIYAETMVILNRINSFKNDHTMFVGERECQKIGGKRSCAACHIVVHTACLPILRQVNFYQD